MYIHVYMYMQVWKYILNISTFSLYMYIVKYIYTYIYVHFYLQGNVGDFGEEGRAGMRVCCLNVKKYISVIWVHGEDSLALLSCLFYNFFRLTGISRSSWQTWKTW